MPAPERYANSEDVAEAFRDPDRWGHEDHARCLHRYKRTRRLAGQRCGLPAWSLSEDEEPHCEFHSSRQPPNMQDRLEEIWALEPELAEARLPFLALAGVSMEGASLPNADLRHSDLSGARLDHADLSGANLVACDLSGADLNRADLEEANLSGATLAGSNFGAALLSRALLRGARIGSLLKPLRSECGFVSVAADLRGADLTDARLDGATIAPETALDGVKLGDSTKDRPSDSDVPGDPPDVYRQLKLAFQRAGDNARAGEFFFREMRNERLAMLPAIARHRRHAIGRYQAAMSSLLWTPYIWWGAAARAEMAARKRSWRGFFHSARAWLSLVRRQLIYLALERSCGYGERPRWVIGWSARVVLLFALLHAAYGLGAGVEFMQRSHSLWHGLCFSAAAFAHVGYGDLRAGPGRGELLAGLEGAIGLCALALFLVCVIRRLGR